MLFFFELFLFVLVMLTLALGEFVSRGLALGLWVVMTAFASIGYLLARQSLRALADAESSPDAPAEPTGPHGAATVPADASDADAPSPLDEKWARTLLYNWRRTNVLLLLGVVVVGAWYWLGQR
jgi:hypothetical protein